MRKKLFNMAWALAIGLALITPAGCDNGTTPSNKSDDGDEGQKSWEKTDFYGAWSMTEAKRWKTDDSSMEPNPQRRYFSLTVSESALGGRDKYYNSLNGAQPPAGAATSDSGVPCAGEIEYWVRSDNEDAATKGEYPAGFMIITINPNDSHLDFYQRHRINSFAYMNADGNKLLLITNEQPSTQRFVKTGPTEGRLTLVLKKE
jgi:hypothetical protein